MNRQWIIKKQKGQGLVEYSLILVLVAIVVIAGMTVVGPTIGNVFSSINNSLTTAGGGGCPPGQYAKDWGDGIFCTDSATGEPISEIE